ncbi:MAG: hypothetical protein UZ07_CHB004001127 [Chlorobi bacterium OLB7]|nr:MAG: hypothetical protein UZ07_CHB004001127 [Chlorobi bacterium OLB7]
MRPCVRRTAIPPNGCPAGWANRHPASATGKHRAFFVWPLHLRFGWHRQHLLVSVPVAFRVAVVPVAVFYWIVGPFFLLFPSAIRLGRRGLREKWTLLRRKVFGTQHHKQGSKEWERAAVAISKVHGLFINDVVLARAVQPLNNRSFGQRYPGLGHEPFAQRLRHRNGEKIGR